MKQILRYGIIGICGVLITLSGNAFAAPRKDFFDVVKYSVVTEGVVSSFSAHFNGASVFGEWEDLDMDGNLDENERLLGPVRILGRDSDGHDHMHSLVSGVNYNREELKNWAQDNATEILSIIFPGGVEELTGATSESVIIQTTMAQKLFTKALTATQQQQNALSNFKGVLEYQSLDINDDSGHAYSMILGYSNEWDSGMEIGFTMPYRYTTMSDDIDSKSHYIAFDFYGKKAVREWEDMSLNLGGGLFGSLYYVSSDAIDHAGNLKYGANVFSSFDKDFEKGGNLSIGIDVRISAARIPSSLIDDDNIFVEKAVDYVNDLDAVKTITYGINYGIPFKNDTMAVNFEVLRSHYISDDIPDDRDTQTLAGVYLTYSPTQTFVLDIGVHHSFEMEDIDVWGIVVGAVYKF